MQNICERSAESGVLEQLASQFLFRLLTTVVVSDVLAGTEHQVYRLFLQGNMVVYPGSRVCSPVSGVARRYIVILRGKGTRSWCRVVYGRCSNRSDGASGHEAHPRRRRSLHLSERKELHIENAFFDGSISKLNAAHQVL
jgi:hypothetical protein